MIVRRVASNRLKHPDPRSRFIISNDNPFVMLDTKKVYRDEIENIVKPIPLLNKDYLIRLIAKKYGNKLGEKQTGEFNTVSNIRLYFNADAKGYKYFARNIDLRGKYANISVEELEKLLIDDIEKWIDGNEDRISLGKDINISSEDPDDMPPIDNGLDENDFKL
tara:strand:+ start:594 stop:1085 length:492 start_codon:yes stop_codon:yes gene_type:complete